jgi:hypothetical protein
MKNIKRYTTILSVALVILVSCRDDDWAPYPDWNENVGAATKIVVNPARNSFRLGQGIANEYLEFNLNVDGYEITTVSAVDIMFTFTEASPARTVGPKLLKTITAFPSDVRVTPDEAAAAIGGGFTAANFQAGDRFQLTFPIITEDGRRLTVALNSELCSQPAQPLFGGCQVTCNVVN